MKRIEMSFVLAKIPLYFLAAFAAWWLARTVRPITDLVPGLNVWFDPKFIPEPDFFLPFSLFASGGFVVVAILLGCFRFSEEFRWGRESGRLFLSSLFWGMGIISYFALIEREVIFSRMMLAQTMFFSIFLALTGLVFLRYIQQFLWRNGIGVSKIILVGSEANRQELIEILRNIPRFSIAKKTLPGEVSSLRGIDELWFVDRHLPEEHERNLRALCHRDHKVFRFVPGTSSAFAKMELLILGGIPLLRPVPASLSGWGQICKRGADIVLSLLFIILLSPLLLILQIAVKLTSKGPALYTSGRIGRGGKAFGMIKFRSMVDGADRMKAELRRKNHRQDGPFFKVKNDPRVTPFGRFLRRFSLDELPQLFNVVKGNMSLIGPRPHFPEEIDEFTPELRRILSVRPGITGLSQISGRSDLPFDAEINLDLYYIENWSVWLDAKIFLRTIFVVMKGNGAD